MEENDAYRQYLKDCSYEELKEHLRHVCNTLEIDATKALRSDNIHLSGKFEQSREIILHLFKQMGEDLYDDIKKGEETNEL